MSNEIPNLSDWILDVGGTSENEWGGYYHPEDRLPWFIVKGEMIVGNPGEYHDDVQGRYYDEWQRYEEEQWNLRKDDPEALEEGWESLPHLSDAEAKGVYEPSTGKVYMYYGSPYHYQEARNYFHINYPERLAGWLNKNTDKPLVTVENDDTWHRGVRVVYKNPSGRELVGTITEVFPDQTVSISWDLPYEPARVGTQHIHKLDGGQWQRKWASGTWEDWQITKLGPEDMYDSIAFIYDANKDKLMVSDPGGEHADIEHDNKIEISDDPSLTYGRMYPGAFIRHNSPENPEHGVDVYNGDYPFEAGQKALLWLRQHYGTEKVAGWGEVNRPDTPLTVGDPVAMGPQAKNDILNEIKKTIGMGKTASPVTSYQWIPLTTFELKGWEDLTQRERQSWINRAIRHNDRAHKFNAQGGVTGRELWALATKRFENKCAYCSKFLAWGTLDATIDHVHSLTLGGSSTIDNLVPACKSCNQELAKWDERNNPQRKEDYAVPHPEFGGPYIQKKDERITYEPRSTDSLLA